MPDKKQITLELVVNKFKQEVSEASGIAKKFSDRVKQEFSEISEGLSIRAQIKKSNMAELQARIRELKKWLDEDLNLPINLRMPERDRAELEGQLRYAERQLEKVESQAKETADGVSQIGKSSKQISGDIDKSFTKGLKSVKRLTLGFLGARTAFSLFRKYMSNYQSQNEEFANKMQLTTNIITNALAPAFEFFGNVIQYAVIGLARIIELLTGVNILGKTVDNSFKGASKSAKEFNDNLSGLDEISNIQEDSGGLSTGIGSQLKAMEDFQKKIKEVDEWFKKHGIDKIVLGIKDAFVGLWNWAQEHPFMSTALAVGLIGLKTGIIPGLVSLITGPAGLIAAVGILSACTLKNLIDSFINLKEQIDKTKKTANETIDLIKGVSKGREKHTEQLLQNLEDGKYNEDDIRKRYNFINSTLEENAKLLAKDSANFKKYAANLEVLKKSPETIEAFALAVNDSYDSIQNYIDIQEEFKSKIKLTDEETEKYRATLIKIKDEIKKNGAEGEKQKETLNKIDEALNKLNNKNVTAKFNLDTSNAENNMFNFFNRINERFFGGNSLLSKAISLSLPSYDVGTNYVPRDQIALVHEGERIIPKQYNNADYLGQLGNSETNMLLMELNRNILEFANRSQTLNVNGKELAKVTYGDYQEEGSRRGANTSIRRV